MIETCVIPGCFGARVGGSPYCNPHHNARHGVASTSGETATVRPKVAEMMPPPSPPEPSRDGRRIADIREGENSGGDVDYYRVYIEDPKRTEPYMAECEDIIETLKMPFADASAFKAIWRKNAQQALGHMKRGADAHGIRDSEKVEYYGARMKAQAQREARKETAGAVKLRFMETVETGLQKQAEIFRRDLDK